MKINLFIFGYVSICILLCFVHMLSISMINNIYMEEAEYMRNYCKGRCMILNINTEKDLTCKDRYVHQNIARIRSGQNKYNERYNICYRGSWRVAVYPRHTKTSMADPFDYIFISTISSPRVYANETDLISWMRNKHSISDVDDCWYHKNNNGSVLWENNAETLKYLIEVQWLIFSVIIIGISVLAFISNHPERSKINDLTSQSQTRRRFQSIIHITAFDIKEISTISERLSQTNQFHSGQYLKDLIRRIQYIHEPSTDPSESEHKID